MQLFRAMKSRSAVIAAIHFRHMAFRAVASAGVADAVPRSGRAMGPASGRTGGCEASDGTCGARVSAAAARSASFCSATAMLACMKVRCFGRRKSAADTAEWPLLYQTHTRQNRWLTVLQKSCLRALLSACRLAKAMRCSTRERLQGLALFACSLPAAVTWHCMAQRLPISN